VAYKGLILAGGPGRRLLPLSQGVVRTLRWDDPDLGIEWPLIDGEPPTLSPKDADGALLRDAEHYP